MFAHYAMSEEDLYELGTDPHELTTVAGETANASMLSSLR
jgi:hypothetical protein